VIEILIVDDDQVNNFVLKNIIQRAYPDALISIERDGRSALRFLNELDQNRKAFPGILLLDINMPIMSGFEFLDEYHKRFLNKEVSIYMVSSSISKFDQQKANSYSNVHGYITKPLVNQNIIFIVDEYLYSNKSKPGS
jgi:CheY-like chemotaxis protein